MIARSLSFETLKNKISFAPTPKLRFRGHSPWHSAFIYAQSKKRYFRLGLISLSLQPNGETWTNSFSLSIRKKRKRESRSRLSIISGCPHLKEIRVGKKKNDGPCRNPAWFWVLARLAQRTESTNRFASVTSPMSLAGSFFFSFRNLTTKKEKERFSHFYKKTQKSIYVCAL